MFIAKQLGQILTSEGFEVVGTASDGLVGFEKYKELSPGIDLVTMDITMPQMDGVTALEKILEYDKGAVVVMVSALGKEDVVKKCLLMGAKSYIVKPLDRKKVLERIISILKR
jgi:two-component system chemotaxis response regulator CheY